MGLSLLKHRLQLWSFICIFTTQGCFAKCPINDNSFSMILKEPSGQILILNEYLTLMPWNNLEQFLVFSPHLKRTWCPSGIHFDILAFKNINYNVVFGFLDRFDSFNYSNQNFQNKDLRFLEIITNHDGPSCLRCYWGTLPHVFTKECREAGSGSPRL